VATKEVIDALTVKLKNEEGFRDRAYYDTRGFLTFGYGHNLDANPLTKEQFNAVLDDPKAGAEKLLRDDIIKHVNELEDKLPWITTQPINIQIALHDMGFNMGIPSLLKFRNTLRAVKEGRYVDAINGIKRSKYYKQVTNRANRNIDLIGYYV